MEIGILIGRNVPTALQPLNIIYGDEEEPWAEEYKFGWTVIGRVCLGQKTPTSKVTVNRVSVINKEKKIFEPDDVTHLIDNTPSKDMTSPKELQEMMQLDYNELHYSRSVRGTEHTESAEDRRFVKILEEGSHRNS